MKKIEQTLPSMEVAEMVGKEHNDLLKDIRRYYEQLGQGKIPQSEFFTENTYQNSQNKTMPCYNVTKKGCEFIAHKLTGTKGTEFTAKYINKFHELKDHNIELSTLEQIIKRQDSMLRLINRRLPKKALQSTSKTVTINDEYKEEIIKIVESNNSLEYLCGVYSFVTNYICK